MISYRLPSRVVLRGRTQRLRVGQHLSVSHRTTSVRATDTVAAHKCLGGAAGGAVLSGGHERVGRLAMTKVLALAGSAVSPGTRL